MMKKAKHAMFTAFNLSGKGQGGPHRVFNLTTERVLLVSVFDRGLKS